MSANADMHAVASALDNITAGLERALAGVATLKGLLTTGPVNKASFDPAAPENKFEIGGLEKLTPRGIEICYRLFDEGRSRYAVAQSMGISFGASTHRFNAWQKAGGLNRVKGDL